MGRAKDEMIKADERGWAELDTYVCADCVGDSFLKSLVERSVETDTCDYCEQESDEPIAAPATVLQEAIASAVFTYFNEPSDAGVPWEGGECLIECVSTEEVLLSLDLDCDDGLLSDIQGSFRNTEWVPTAHGHWASSHPHEEMSSLWDSFAKVVKQETRFFFTQQASDVGSEDEDPHRQFVPPHVILWHVGKIINEVGLTATLPSATRLYRVRERSPQDIWELDAAHLGPPPLGMASAGRMNPAGISYFYLALEPETALAEVLSRPPCVAALAGYKAVSEIAVIDFSNIADRIPSIFDARRRDLREALLFIDYFVSEIGKPVYKDGREHIEYLPSQVISEYLAKVFKLSSGQSALGMIYPSAVQPGGRNVVLFPPDRSHKEWTHLLTYESAGRVQFKSWADFTAAIAPR